MLQAIFMDVKKVKQFILSAGRSELRDLKQEIQEQSLVPESNEGRGSLLNNSKNRL